MYLIEILHQTTTTKANEASAEVLYLIEILHQTTTLATIFQRVRRCILSKFYIKPQLVRGSVRRSSSCILSKFYIKPQRHCRCSAWSSGCILSKFYIKPQPSACEICRQIVVSYRNSTSNHNHQRARYVVKYVVSYRNSTSNHNALAVAWSSAVLYLIEILHQTTTRLFVAASCESCILSKFYIKPQPRSYSAQ